MTADAQTIGQHKGTDAGPAERRRHAGNVVKTSVVPLLLATVAYVVW